MELASEAITANAMASRWDTTQKSSVPYILRPMEVSAVVGTMLDNRNLIAVLHYRSFVDLTERLSDASEWLEYKTLAELVFGKGV